MQALDRAKRNLTQLSVGLLVACSTACGADAASGPADGGPRACVACHMPEYLSAANHPGKKPTECAVCHSQDGWHPSRLEHTWPLTGAHAKADCFACHKGQPPVYRETPKECVGCHRHDYDTAPNHSHRSTACEGCHSTAAWKPTITSHDAGTSAAPTATADARHDAGGHPAPAGRSRSQ